MDIEKELQKIINRMARDSQKATAMAKELFGNDAQLFAEGSGLFVMDGDEDASNQKRQEHIKMEANTHWSCGGGAW